MGPREIVQVKNVSCLAQGTERQTQSTKKSHPTKDPRAHPNFVCSRAQRKPLKVHTTKVSKTKMDSGANFTAAINALVGERDRHFLLRVAAEFNLPFEQLSKLYLETGATAVKVPRKYTKKPKAVNIVTEGDETAPAAKPKAEKQKSTACTSKTDPCKFSALKGEVFCKRHLRASQEATGEAPPKEPKVKKPVAKPLDPVHTHAPTTEVVGDCAMCQTNGNVLAPAPDEFEVVLGHSGTAPIVQTSVADRLAAILADDDDEEEADSDSETDYGLSLETYDDE